MAKELGINHSFVGRVWKEAGLKPHLSGQFKISNDPDFESKLHDVVGLYLSPPENAVVFCVDEKSSIQALDRTQPGLPMKKGRRETMTHDYKRNGTSTYLPPSIRPPEKLSANARKNIAIRNF